MATAGADAPTARAAPRVSAWLPYAWVVVLVALVLLPTWWPGYVLSYDLVFTPRQDLLPAAVGLGGGLPRAVPQDAVVAVLTTVVPGWLVEKVALTAALVLAGTGVVRLLHGRPTAVRALGGTLYVWNAWVAERLVIGHWGLLLAYGLLPWALLVARDVRRGRHGAAPRLLLLCAAAALTPSGGLLVALVAVPVAVGPRAAGLVRDRVLVVVTAVAVNAPWWLPSVLHPAAGASDPAGVAVFGLRPEGPWGELVTALGLGGIWNADVVLGSRAWGTAALLAVLVVALAVVGARPTVDLLGRAAAGWLALLSALGLLLAVASAGGRSMDAVAWLVETVPGAGLLRDAHKLLAPLALLLALAAALGAGRLLRRILDPEGRAAVGVLLVVAPVVVLPDLAWGAAGRLRPVEYPSDWSAVRRVLAESPRPGDVAALPWSAFRRFDWNDGRTVLDPAPRWLPRTTVVDDTLLVQGPGDELVRVGGEDPRAAAIAAALAEDRPLATVLPGLGVGWVLLEREVLVTAPRQSLAGLTPVWTGPDLVLYDVPGEIASWPLPSYGLVVIAVDAAVVALLGILTGVAVVRRGSRRPQLTYGQRAQQGGRAATLPTDSD
ncbi:MAG: hypothetical protein R2737_11370 [Candidatus Nanopelagicales bacterium]